MKVLGPEGLIDGGGQNAFVIGLTRSALNTLVSGSGVVAKQAYLITDEGRIAIGLTTTTYQAFGCLTGGNTWSGTQTLGAGTTTVAPLKFQAGSVLTTPVAHSFEWDGTNLFVTQASGSTRKTLAYADGSITGSAATLTTGRTLAITGDLSWTSPSFNGSGNVTAAGTLATVNSNVGSFGSATASAVFTVNAKGLITAASSTTITPAWGSITSKPTTIAGYGLTDAASKGANTFTGAQTITTAAATPIRSLDIGGTTTAFNYAAMSNTSGGLWWGVEGSSAGQIFSGSLAYAAVIGTPGATALHLCTNGNSRLKIDSAGVVSIGGSVVLTAATGGASFVGKTTTYTAVAGDKVLADTSGSSWTLSLPASPSDGDTVQVMDAQMTFVFNPLTISGNGHDIVAVGYGNVSFSSLTADAQGGLMFVYSANSGTWAFARFPGITQAGSGSALSTLFPVPGGWATLVMTGTPTATSNGKFIVDSTAGSTLYLPGYAAAGTTTEIVDMKGSFGTNNLTLASFGGATGYKLNGSTVTALTVPGRYTFVSKGPLDIWNIYS